MSRWPAPLTLVLACVGGAAVAATDKPVAESGVAKGPLQIVREIRAGTQPAAPSKVDALPPEPRKLVAEVLAPRRFAFCHQPDYPLTPAEKQWCDLGVGQNTAACPTLAEACKRDALAKQMELEEPLSIRLPELGLPLRILLWTLLGLGIGLLLFALIRHFLDRETKDVVTVVAPVSESQEMAAVLARQVETDVQRLLERARAEASAGDFRAAVGSVYAALLRRLEGAGLLRVEPDQTNGDYLSLVKKQRPAIAPRVSEVVAGVEVAQFGESAVTREQFDGLWLRVTALLTERIGILALVVGLFVGLGCGQPREDWEHSPSGRAGVLSFLGKRGFTLHERLVSVAKIGESQAAQLVLFPGAHLREEEWKALARWIEQGGHSLIVAGGRRDLPEWIGMRVVAAPAAASSVIAPAADFAKEWGAVQIRVPAANRLECSAGSETVLERKPAIYAAMRWFGDDAASRVVVLADDYLLRNASLLVADNALALDTLFRGWGTSIDLAGDLTGLVSQNPVQSVQRGRLGPALLQLAALLALFFVCKGARFGRAVPDEARARREFVEHVGALGLHYARARGERTALGYLGTYAIERLRERCGLRVDRSLSGLAEAVAARTGRPVGDIMRMFVEARDAARGVAADSDARDLQTTFELCKLLEETGGAGGHKPIQSDV